MSKEELLEIAEKADWEGGFVAFFCDYTSEKYEGTPLESPVRKLREAVSELRVLLCD
jgi:hypothetical protein